MPALKPGRPKGSTMLDKRKTKNVTVRLTPQAYKWLQEKPRGWLSEWIETESRKGQK